MSVARTSRRRRKQASMGKKGLEQVFGKRHAPNYPHSLTTEASAKRELRSRQRRAEIAARNRKGK